MRRITFHITKNNPEDSYDGSSFYLRNCTDFIGVSLIFQTFNETAEEWQFIFAVQEDSPYSDNFYQRFAMKYSGGRAVAVSAAN